MTGETSVPVISGSLVSYGTEPEDKSSSFYKSLLFKSQMLCLCRREMHALADVCL